MSFAGHVLDMINRDKQNRALRAHIRERLNRKSTINPNPNNLLKHERVKEKSMSAEEISAMRLRIKRRMQKKRKARNIKVLITFLLASSLLIYLIYGMIFA